MLPFDHCVSLCNEEGVPIIVDATAEEDLTRIYGVDVKPDGAGRSFRRVTIGSQSSRFDVKEPVGFLEDSEPSIRTRNHHLDQGYLMLYPQELTDNNTSFINQRLLKFAAQYD